MSSRPGGGGRLVARSLGELLVTAGALVLLFVAWQLVWTDVVAGQTQRAAVTELQDGFEPAPAPAPAPQEPAPTAQDPATAPVLAEPGAGEPFAVLHVPRFAGPAGEPYAVGAEQGVGLREVLNDGLLGHYPGTAMPGGVGNAAFAGHRTTYGKPLSRVDELVPGDPLVVEAADAWYVYRVTGAEVVAPEQVDVIAPVPGDPAAQPVQRLITLTACHPRFSARQRYVVHGELESWQPRASGAPAALTEPVGATPALAPAAG